MTGRYSVLIIVAMCSVVVSCSPPEGPRELPSATFDPRLPFPELDRSDSDSSEDNTESGYEDRIARATGESEPEEDATTSRQLVPLANNFVAEIPSNFDQWQWSGDARTTLISYREPGSTEPSAMIYIESFSSLIRTSPSFEMNRFHRTVDPNLAQDLIPPTLRSIGADFAAKKTDLPIDQLVEAFMRASSHTMGSGLNYRSTEDSFSGWKWVGKSERDVEFRLARTDGGWFDRTQFEPTVQRALTRAAGESEAFRGVSDAYADIRRREDVSEQNQARAAWMILGTASTSPASGVHVALVCRSQPACPVAEELAHMLSTLRVADANTLGQIGQPTTSSPSEKARQLGIPYLPSSELMSPDKMQSILQELQRASTP